MTDRSSAYDTHLALYSSQFNISYGLLCSIITVESGWDPWAIRFEPSWAWTTKDFSNKAAALHITSKTELALQSFSYGLCQIMGSVLRELGFDGPLNSANDPELNIKYGAMFISSLKKKYEKSDDLIASYNAGHPDMDPITFRYKNQSYVDSVNAVWEKQYNRS